MPKKKVLIVRLSAMGDVIFTIPLANILKKHGYYVSWLVSEKGYSLIKNNPCVDKVILAPIEKWKKNKTPFKNFLEYLSIIKQIRKEKFDIALDIQLILKSLIWMIFSGAKRRIVAKGAREFSILGGNEVMPKIRHNYEPHAVLGYLKYAKYLGIDDDEIIVTLPETTKETKEKIDFLLKDINKTKPLILLAPATTWDTKHWDKENWKKLISKIEDKFTIVLSGSKNDFELCDYISSSKHLNLAGKTNLEELIELIKRAKILVSMDSGTTHLGWATNSARIVSIFCATPKSLYAPIGNHIACAQNVCEPCHKRKCPKKNQICTKYPKVEEVFEAIMKLNY